VSAPGHWTAGQRCRSCKEPIPKPTYTISQRQRGRPRLYCSNLCHLDALRARQLSIVGKKPLRVLEAGPSPRRVPTWDEAPDRCLKCSGLWRRTQAGYICTLCGYDLFVLTALSRLEANAPGWA
jgi:hypothetical protein